jgi:hypothetical protein
MSSLSAPEPQASTVAYALIRQAIEQRMHFLATYHGFHRETCPHSIGINRREAYVVNWFAPYWPRLTALLKELPAPLSAAA